MIHAVDKSVSGGVHVAFNSAMLTTLAVAYPTEIIVFYAEATHLQFVKDKIPETLQSQFQFETITIDGNFSSGVKKVFQITRRITGDIKYFKTLLARLNNEKDTLVVLNLPPISNYFFKKAKRNFPAINTVICLHGEIEFIYFAKGAREKCIGWIYKKFFALSSERLRYLFLNKIAASKFVEDGYVTKKNSAEISHPYLFSEIRAPKRSDKNLVLGHVGSLGLRKSGHLFYELASKLEGSISSGKLQLQTIGVIEPDLDSYVNSKIIDFVQKGSNGTYLPRTLFEEKTSLIDYALFFYNPSQFIYRASGAILDVIQFEKPIIVLQHPYFESLFKLAGDIGYSCKDVDEMSALIITLAEEKNKIEYEQKYLNQQRNMHKLKSLLSIDSIAYDLKHQFLS